MERKIIERYKCHLHFFDTSKELCAYLLRRFLLDRCMLRYSLFIREQSRNSFSILITVSILKGQFSLHKHLEVIKLKGQSIDKTKDNMPAAGIHFHKQNSSLSKLNPQISRSQDVAISFLLLQQNNFTSMGRVIYVHISFQLRIIEGAIKLCDN